MPGMVLARGSAAASRQVLGDAVLGDPAGDALAERDPQLVRASRRRTRRPGPASRPGRARSPTQPVDPDVVVVDELAQLGRDGQADLADAGQVVEAGARAAGSTGAGPPRSPSAGSSGRSGWRRSPGSPGRRSCRARRSVQACGCVVVDVEQPEQLGRRPSAARCRSCRSPPGRRRRGRRRRAGRRGRPSTKSGRRAAMAARGQAIGAGTSRTAARYSADSPRLTSATAWPSGRRRKTAARSPSNRTMAWSTRPARIRSRSSRLPMSPATRRRASARWSEVGDLLLAAGDADDRAERVGDDRREVACSERRGIVAVVGRRRGARPTARRGRGWPPRARRARRAGRVSVTRSRGPATTGDGVGRSVIRPGRRGGAASSARPSTPKPRGRSSSRGAAPGRRTAVAQRREPLAAQLPDRDEGVAAGGADRRGDAAEVLLQVVADRGSAGRCASRSARSRAMPVTGRRRRLVTVRGPRGRVGPDVARGRSCRAAARRPVAGRCDRAGLVGRPASSGRAARRRPGTAGGRRADSAGRRAG